MAATLPSPAPPLPSPIDLYLRGLLALLQPRPAVAPRKPKPRRRPVRDCDPR